MFTVLVRQALSARWGRLSSLAQHLMTVVQQSVGHFTHHTAFRRKTVPVQHAALIQPRRQIDKLPPFQFALDLQMGDHTAGGALTRQLDKGFRGIDDMARNAAGGGGMVRTSSGWPNRFSNCLIRCDTADWVYTVSARRVQNRAHVLRRQTPEASDNPGVLFIFPCQHDIFALCHSFTLLRAQSLDPAAQPFLAEVVAIFTPLPRRLIYTGAHTELHTGRNRP